MASKTRNRSNRSVMKHNFSQIPSVEIPRSSFDRSHGLKTTFDAGYLVPILVDEALPGDTFNLNMTAFARLATPIKPIMDNMFMETFFFAVPNRLVWEHWQQFNGEQDNPGDPTDYTIPKFRTDSEVLEGTLHDYMGVPPGLNPSVDGKEFSSLFARAYALIWNEWFRDQNLQERTNFEVGDGQTAFANYPLLRRGKRHDYFTSCLPWPQKGDPVTIPLGIQAPIASDALNRNELTIFGTAFGDDVSMFSDNEHVEMAPDSGGGPTAPLYADLTDATAITINQLREGFQVQRMFERDARGGTRYTEILRSHFGVTSSDQRLQRPEYLGGGSSPINITPIAQTTGEDDFGTDTPQGNLAAIGTSVLRNHGFTKSFTEHCIIIGLVNVRADLTYQQGLNRMFSRETRFDFYWPSLSHLGEQIVFKREIMVTPELSDPNGAFGYQERYAEYRYKPSMITGKFRSEDPVSLDVWHLSQDFETVPVLNDEFIQDTPPLDRVIAVTDEPHFLFDAHFQYRCARPMPLYGVPGLIDHF